VLINLLLEKGADANRAARSGFTPLMAAARTGKPIAMRALRGKARFPSDPVGVMGLLAEACVSGNQPLAKEMLALVPAAARPKLPWPNYLELALLGGSEELVAWLLQQGGPKLASQGGDLQPLLAAILPTRPEKSAAIRERLVTKLLAAGADPNAVRNGVTPLLLAARHGNGAMVTALLAAGANANAKDHKMRNALLLAAAANQPLEVIAPLLKAGLDPNEEDSNTDLSILATYATHGNLEACAALLAAGADPNAESTFGLTPLLAATNTRGSTDEAALAVVSLLLKQGAKPDDFPATPEDCGPLIGAIGANRSTLIRPLVDAGAQVNRKFMVGKVTPLAVAAAVSTPATVRALLDAGADPKTLDIKGVSPLAHAAAAGRTANMTLLLAHGVSPDATAPEAVPPILLAAATGQLRAVRLLLAAGANPAAIHPETKNTALETAKSRGDQAMVTLLENASLNQ
jgi:ankyrin repeat protein